MTCDFCTCIFFKLSPAAIIIFRIFLMEPHRLQFPFCRDSVRQFWTELFAKTVFNFWRLVTLTLGKGHWKSNRLVQDWLRMLRITTLRQDLIFTYKSVFGLVDLNVHDFFRCSFETIRRGYGYKLFLQVSNVLLAQTLCKKF